VTRSLLETSKESSHRTLWVHSCELVRRTRRVSGCGGGGRERQRTVEATKSPLASSPRTTLGGLKVGDRSLYRNRQPDRGCDRRVLFRQCPHTANSGRPQSKGTIGRKKGRGIVMGGQRPQTRLARRHLLLLPLMALRQASCLIWTCSCGMPHSPRPGSANRVRVGDRLCNGLG